MKWLKTSMITGPLVGTGRMTLGFGNCVAGAPLYHAAERSRGERTMNLKGLWLALMTLSFVHGAQAAEVKVLASNSVRTMLEDIAPLFARASGHTVTLGFGTSAQVAKRVAAG